MILRYHDALSRCLEAIAEGRDLEAIIAELPQRYRERLRRDATLTQAVRDHAAALPPPSAAAEAGALSRLNAEINAARVSRRAPAARSLGGIFGMPRFVLAGLLLAALLVGTSFLLIPNRAGDGTVEAAEFEGVVIASGEGSLTVQTLDSLEEVTVPFGAAVIDEDGAALDLATLQTGEVVLVRGSREDSGPVRAADILRRTNGLPGWCDDNGERCRQIAQSLRDAQARCEAAPDVCEQLNDRVSGLIDRVIDIANLEDLKQRCRAGGEGCRDITSFCREHPDACIRDTLPGPITDRLDDARQRLQELEGLCNDRDTSACRQIAQLCADHPAACDRLPLQRLR